MSENFKGFIYEKDGDGIVTLTMDMAGPVNAMNADFREALVWFADKLDAEEGLKGVVMASAKGTFFAGADLKELEQVQPGSEQALFDMFEKLKLQLRRIEKLPVPVVAAINGAALGGGLEICLACNHRIAWNSPKVVLGLPEVTLGLLPGAGGIVRTIHKIGLDRALPLLLEGVKFGAAEGKDLGIIDAVVDTREELVPAAKAWIKQNPGTGIKPWDMKGYKLIPAGSTIALLQSAGARYFAKHRGLLPAPERILSVAHDTYVVNFDTALRIETRGLIELLMTPEAKNQINSNFLQLNKVNSGASRPQGIDKSKLEKVGIVGGGKMGQGIAHASAMKGIQVVVVDKTTEEASQARAYCEKVLANVPAKKMSDEAKAEIGSRIAASADYGDLKGCELIIESVYEDRELKAAVIGELEAALGDSAVIATNTSSLPIASLSGTSGSPETFIGMHFFSPADKMPLVEITCSDKTSDATLAKAYDFAKQLGKTPIVVNDAPGFFTTRVFNTYIDEGCRLLKEGMDPVFIEHMGRYMGMPVGPLAIHDEVSQALVSKITLQGEDGSRADASVAAEVAATLIAKGRSGRGHGGGFYEYADDGSKDIWPGLFELYAKEDADIGEQDTKDRLLFRQVIESLKCLEEGVLRSVPDGNIGSLMGIAAPTWTGGFIQFVNTYGLQRFIDRCDELAGHYGERFKVPAIVAEKLAAGAVFE